MADFLAGNKTGLKNKLMGMMANAPNGLENTVILEGRNVSFWLMPRLCLPMTWRGAGKDVYKIQIFGRLVAGIFPPWNMAMLQIGGDILPGNIQHGAYDCLFYTSRCV